MKLLHISDLHLGKRLFEYSLIEDQKHILDRILKICLDEKPDILLIAGDVYDKPVPPAEAVTLFNDFLCSLSASGIRTAVISGNHDSPERLAFGSALMMPSGIMMCPVWDGETQKLTLSDEYGDADIFLLPFIKPAHVRRYYPDADIETYTDALSAVIGDMRLFPDNRSLLVTHQFVTGASRCDSEDVSVGGSDNVDASIFDGFDYVALGHIHSPQNVGSERVRYSGTPLKYSFSEVSHEKSVTVAELFEKGRLNIRTVPLIPLRDMRELKGSYDELSLRENYINTNTDDYIHITLTDEDDIPDAAAKLRSVYKNLMKLDYDNKRTRASTEVFDGEIEKTSPTELFAEFFRKQNGRYPDEKQYEYLKELVADIFEGRDDK